MRNLRERAKQIRYGTGRQALTNPSGNEFYNFNLNHVTPKVVDANGIEISAQYSLTGNNAWISWACAAENYGDFMTVYIALVADPGYQWNTSGDLYSVHT